MDTKSLFKTDKYFIIDTRTVSNKWQGRQVEYKDYTKNPEYAALIKKEEDRTLADLFPRLKESVAAVASNHHSDRMASDPACNVAEVCDEDGFIFFTPDKEKECKELLTQLQGLDKGIHLSKYGRQFGDKSPAVKKA